MSQKLQWLFGGFRQTPLFRVYSFFVGFFILKWALTQVLLRSLSLSSGLSDLPPQAIENNEIFIQSMALLLSVWLVFGRASIRALSDSVGETLGIQQRTLRGRRLFAEAMGPAAKAFLWASLGVTLSLVFGLLRVEGPILDISWVGYWAPVWFLKAASIVMWVLVLELVRVHMLKALTYTQGTEFLGRLAMILFEGYLIFKVFRLPGEPLEQGLVALTSVWAASALQLWAHATEGRGMAAWKRVVSVATFLITVYGVYGLPFAWGRSISLYSAFPTGVSPSMGILAEPYLLGNVIFIVLLSGLSMLLLRRVQTRTI